MTEAGSVPVVLVSFNRPDRTRAALERTATYAPADLFLVCDGPRDHVPTDAARCAEVRQLLESPGWQTTVHRRYFDANGGVEATVERGLDWVFSQVDRAIVIEDDCLPDPTFFAFCEELLERYVDDDEVWQVAGNSLFVPPKQFEGDSYGFSGFAAVWGWATWARAWHAHRALFPRSQEPGDRLPRRTREPQFDGKRFLTAAGMRYLREVAGDVTERNFGWDSHWYVSLADSSALCITPATNMVTNTGFDQDATSTNSTRVMPDAEPIAFPLTHPASVQVRPAVQRELELVLVRANGSLARRMRKLVPAGPLRAIARVIATGPITRVAMRWIAAALQLLRGKGQK